MTNENIDLITNWIDNYFHNSYNNKYISLPEINLYNNNINFDSIKKSLIRSKQLIDKNINEKIIKLKLRNYYLRK